MPCFLSRSVEVVCSSLATTPPTKQLVATSAEMFEPNAQTRELRKTQFSSVGTKRVAVTSDLMRFYTLLQHSKHLSIVDRKQLKVDEVGSRNTISHEVWLMPKSLSESLFLTKRKNDRLFAASAKQPQEGLMALEAQPPTTAVRNQAVARATENVFSPNEHEKYKNGILRRRHPAQGKLRQSQKSQKKTLSLSYSSSTTSLQHFSILHALSLLHAVPGARDYLPAPEGRCTTV